VNVGDFINTVYYCVLCVCVCVCVLLLEFPFLFLFFYWHAFVSEVCVNESMKFRSIEMVPLFPPSSYISIIILSSLSCITLIILLS
jgi:hypothetical protein